MMMGKYVRGRVGVKTVTDSYFQNRGQRSVPTIVFAINDGDDNDNDIDNDDDDGGSGCGGGNDCRYGILTKFW